ncbi:MAG: hypothetical protein KGH53_02235 [Candidatus Micrarchaeota archaeon]|nr:hypothetical protein [Candidatus Micrarchaeota archaeon]
MALEKGVPKPKHIKVQDPEPTHPYAKTALSKLYEIGHWATVPAIFEGVISSEEIKKMEVILDAAFRQGWLERIEQNKKKYYTLTEIGSAYAKYAKEKLERLSNPRRQEP